MRAILLLLAGTLATGPVHAQRPAQAQQQLRERGADTSLARRTRLEMELRRNFARLVKDQLGLTDEQMRRLAPITLLAERRRRDLQRQEREARTLLRDVPLGNRVADSALVDFQIKRLIRIQKDRAQILEVEQQQMSTFMTPLQRARFMAMQEQIRRRLEQMRQRRAP